VTTILLWRGHSTAIIIRHRDTRAIIVLYTFFIITAFRKTFRGALVIPWFGFLLAYVVTGIADAGTTIAILIGKTSVTKFFCICGGACCCI